MEDAVSSLETTIPLPDIIKRVQRAVNRCRCIVTYALTRGNESRGYRIYRAPSPLLPFVNHVKYVSSLREISRTYFIGSRPFFHTFFPSLGKLVWRRVFAPIKNGDPRRESERASEREREREGGELILNGAGYGAKLYTRCW